MDFVAQFAAEFAGTERRLLKRIVSGSLIHVDETKINIHGENQYVWVLTDGCRAIFRRSLTRETRLIRDLIRGYQGTLVSDFYGGYDAVPCRQQKCIVHLIRDLNDDLWKNPFNDEYNQFTATVRDLLVPMLGDAQRFGLKAFYLRKHKLRVDRFYRDTIDSDSLCQELTAKYKKRFERYKESLFTFLERDGVPWNNNAAERAIRHLAVQRKISGAFSTIGADHYLCLFAIAQTCRFQEKSFLGFLLSGLKDVDAFAESRRGRRNR